jgi:hypothetical protein
MADASDFRLNIDAPVVKRGRGRPRGSKNKTTVAAMGASSSALVKPRPSRPAGSKSKPKVPSAIPGPSAPSLVLLLRHLGSTLSFVSATRSAARFNACH